jgi:hypothetical protein
MILLAQTPQTLRQESEWFLQAGNCTIQIHIFFELLHKTGIIGVVEALMLYTPP